MTSMWAVGIAMLVAGLPLVAAAQSSAPSTGDLEMKAKQRRSVVLPKPSPEQIRTDADAAVSEYAATQKNTGKVVRETSPVRPSARPDLDTDVRSGIQGQRLNDALKNR
jgi:hypothetical protein